ncbi:MAG: hypothetical protein ACRENE_26825 [Polyangiaceae bacterium]
MRSYRAACYVLIVTGWAVVSALSACATGADTSMIPNGLMGGGGTSSNGGGSSNGGVTDATTSSSSGGSTSSSSGSYTDDSTNPTPTPTDDGGTDAADEPAPVGPTCTPGQACVDSIPTGWNGFVQLLVNGTGVDAGCAGSYDTVQPSIGGQTNPDGGPATCGSCTCTAPEGGAGCSVGVGNINLLCFPANGPTTTINSGTCTTISAASGQVTAAMSTGQCDVGSVTVTTPAPAASWSMAVACGMSGEGGAAPGGEGGAAGEAGAATGTMCASGQACAAMPAGGASDAGMPSGVCIYQAGVQSCPPSGTTLFTNTFVVGAVEDSRTCGCTCGSLTCPTDGVVNVYTQSGCAGTVASAETLGSACKNGGVNGAKSAMYVASTTGKLATCGAGTSAPAGTVDIDGGSATTFCCIP